MSILYILYVICISLSRLNMLCNYMCALKSVEIVYIL